nr:unknown [Zea mays]
MNTSSSSDHRRKRRKGSKKDKRKLTKRKGKHTRSKRKSRGSKRRPRRSYGSSSDDSVSSKTDNSSSDSENGGHYTKRSLPKDKESTKMTNSEQGRTFPDVDKVKQTVTTINRSQSHDGSKPSNKDDNGADDRSGNYSSKDRNDPGASSRISPIQTDVNLTKPVNVYGNIGGDNADAGMSITGTERHLPSNEPVSTNGKDLAVGSADNGQPQRIRKGRGFTQKYGFARRYRTPSPERPPVRPRYDGGREDRWNNFNRYQRRGRSRSRSPATRHDRGGYRRPSPRRSRSPADPRRDANDRPRSGHGGGGPDHRGHIPPANNRSRSKSRDPLRSRSPDAAPAKRESSRYNRRRSSSSRSSSPDADGNKGLVSY